MSNDKRNPIKLPRGTPGHAAVMAAAGGYVVYLGYKMVQNTLSGQSTMPLTTTYILAGIMALIGLAVIAYGIAILVSFVRHQKENKDG